MIYEPILEATRGENVESIHYGAIAISDASGRLYAYWADPEVVTFPRSAAKPFQALPLLEKGGQDRYGFTLKQIAVICSSHSGTDEHVAVVASIQQKIGVGEEQLLCGAHPPLDPATASLLREKGEEPTPIRNNCSGKHTGMLALAILKDSPLKDYVNPQHPIQVEILHAFAEMCDIPPERVGLGIDGCSAPVFAVPLRTAATAFARLADPAGLSPTRRNACHTIFKAMTNYPGMVAGPGRFDTRLMTITQGRMVSKAGAEGFQGIGLPPGAISPGSPGLGVAIKIADGDFKNRARPLVTVEVLSSLGALREGEDLISIDDRTVKNWRGLKVGELRPCFRLISVD